MGNAGGPRFRVPYLPNQGSAAALTTLKEFEEALKAAGNAAALEILDKLRDRDRASRSIRPARRVVGQKMTPELAQRILELHQTTTMTQQEIAFQLGVNQGRVNEVIKRGKWLNSDPNSAEAVARDKALQRAKEGVGIKPRKAPRQPAPDRPQDAAPKAATRKKARDAGRPVQLLLGEL